MSRVKRKKREYKKKRKNILTVSSILLLLTSFLFLLFSYAKLDTNKNNTIVDRNETSAQISQDKNNVNGKSIANSKSLNSDSFLFLGDSFTTLLQTTIEKHNPNAIVMGQVGVQPNYWNENFNALPDNDDIDGVILLIGVNGAAYSDNIPDTKQLIDSLVDKYKNKTIYVEKVFPVGKKFSSSNPKTFNKAIQNHNEEIKTYCNKYDNVVFIDTTKGFVTKSGYLKYTKDGLHISTDKQEAFYKNIINAIKSY